MTKSVDSPQATLINTGLESSVYRVVLEDGQTYIIKQRTSKGRQNYLFEAFAYQELLDKGAHVPSIKSVTENELVITSFSGSELDDQTYLYRDVELFDAIARDLALCRDVTFSGFGETIIQADGTFKGSYSTWSDYLDTAQDMFDSKEIELSGLTHDEIEVMKQYWLRMRDEIHLPQGNLVHGDFAMSAIFVNNGKYEGIIDFGDAFIGDPLMDIAYFRFKEITKSYGEEVYERLIESYAHTTNFIISDAVQRKILFYMIYWGLLRVVYCPDPTLRRKFVQKLKVVKNSL